MPCYSQNSSVVLLLLILPDVCHAQHACHVQAQAAEIPSVQQLVDGAAAIANSSSGTVFSLASLLSTLCSHDNGKDRAMVITKLLQQLQGGTDPAGSPSLQDRSDESLLAPAHLLAVLVTDDAIAREAAASQGAAWYSCIAAACLWD